MGSAWADRAAAGMEARMRCGCAIGDRARPVADGLEPDAVGGACVHVGGGLHERILPRDVHERDAVCAVWACRVRPDRAMGRFGRVFAVGRRRGLAIRDRGGSRAGDGRALQHARRGGRNAAGLGEPSADEKMSGSARSPRAEGLTAGGMQGERPWEPLILILDSNIESRIPCATHTRIVRMHAAPSHAESDAPLAL